MKLGSPEQASPFLKNSCDHLKGLDYPKADKYGAPKWDELTQEQALAINEATERELKRQLGSAFEETLNQYADQVEEGGDAMKLLAEIKNLPWAGVDLTR